MSLAPICFFTYNRLEETKKTIEALRNNYLAKESQLYIFSDGAKSDTAKEKVDKVRAYLKTIKGFGSVQVFESPINKGLANSIIEGVTQVVNQYGKVIVLEDDLITSPNFLNYMNQALDFYNDISKVFSITGYSIQIKTNHPITDVYYTSRASSWGWATWSDRWQAIDWEASDYLAFKKNKELRRNFNKMGSDMTQMLDRQMQGKLDSWAIRWCYHQYKYNLFSVHPLVSKINNIGFNSPDATNTSEKFNRYKTKLDQSNKTSFQFSNDIYLEHKIINQFIKPFTIFSRIKYKIINLVFKN
jgi:hypothetical protein